MNYSAITTATTKMVLPSLSGYNAKLCFLMEKGDTDRQRDEAMHIRRNIVLYPDLNAFNKWSLKATQLSHLASFTVSEVLEKNATGDERKQGLDLADYLVREGVREGSSSWTR
jgi:hypothetical protein